MGLYKSLEEISNNNGLEKVLSLINIFENHEPILNTIADFYKIKIPENFVWDNFKVNESGIKGLGIRFENGYVNEISFYFNEPVNLQELSDKLGEFNIIFNWKDIISYFDFTINTGYLKEVYFRKDEEFHLINGKIKSGKNIFLKKDVNFKNITLIFNKHPDAKGTKNLNLIE